MSNQNYIIEMLELKDSNIFFKENCYYKEKIKGVIHKIFEGYLSYNPTHCYKCGVIFDDNFEKHGFITSNIKIPDVSGFKSILKFHKQRYLCKYCNKAFTLSTTLVNYGCFISNNTKHKIASDLVKKRSEKDIALDNNVSPNNALHNFNPNISSYMKTSIKTLTEFLPFIKNTFTNNFHNGFIEGNNNFIKVIKRIAFGFRFFKRFKARIMICKGLLKN